MTTVSRVKSGNPATKRVAYGWAENGKFYLSPFDKDVIGRPRNEYETQQAAKAEAAQRGYQIEWEA